MSHKFIIYHKQNAGRIEEIIREELVVFIKNFHFVCSR